MSAMVNYIFGSLQTSEDAIRSIRKTIHKQEKINRMLIVLPLYIGAYLMIVEFHNREQDKRIEELAKELKELKHKEGE